MTVHTAASARLLAGRPEVGCARALIDRTDGTTIAEQRTLALIPSPPFGEAQRGEWVRRRFIELGLSAVHVDEAGNVLGVAAGLDTAAAPVVVAAHLDTVFPAGTAIELREENNRTYAPGIADNARGLAAMLAIIRAMVECRVETRSPVVFVASVGEEGIGDLRGVKHLFRDGSEYRAAGAFIALDGTDSRRVVASAIGSVRYRITVHGPGGHSWADRGVPSAVHALGEAISALGRLQLPEQSGWAINVGRIGGGTSINAIAEDAWLDLDLRCEDRAGLVALERSALEAVTAAVHSSNSRRRRGSPSLRFETDAIGRRPPGRTPPDADIVAAAKAATREIGRRPQVVASSTDANVAMAEGIPAISIGAGGESGGMHTIREWYDNRRGPDGIFRALLTLLAVADART